MIDTYTRLLEAVAEQGDPKAADAAVSKLIVHLKSSGRMKMLPQIASELRQVMARRQALDPVVEVADAHHAAQALKSAKEAGIIAKKARVNPTLLSGWRGRSQGLLVDCSGKRALVDIYKGVTN